MTGSRGPSSKAASSDIDSWGFSPPYQEAGNTAVVPQDVNGTTASIAPSNAALSTKSGTLAGFTSPTSPHSSDVTGTGVNSGPDQYVSADSSASGTTLSRGIQHDFGTTNGITITGGYQVVEVGGTANGTTLSGGDQYVFGIANATTVNDKSSQIVEAGGRVSDTTLNGGSLIGTAGATVAGTVTFVGGGQLTLDQSANISNLQVAGFDTPSDKLDLTGIAFGPQTTVAFFSEANNAATGTLTVSNGVNTANITLLGQHTTANFTVAADTQGGTIVTDPPNPTVPVGVTLQQIDGGPNYYGNNGFTYAAAAGWDSPNFFPIGPWLDWLGTQSDANRWLDLGLNTAFGFASNSSLSLMSSNGIWAVAVNQELSLELSNNGGSLGSNVVGEISYDEPNTFAQGISTPLSTTSNSVQDGRFWWTNFTNAFLYYGALLGTPSPGTAAADLFTPINTPDGSQRHIDDVSVDIYWFSGAKADVSAVLGTGGLYDNLGRAMTPDEAARGSNYGDMIDRERAITGGTIPIFAYVEDGGPWLEDTSASYYITPPELNWAVWSSLIHGARGVVYFNHTFAGPGGSPDNLAQPFYQTIQPAQTISIYDQVQETDALIKQLAPVLNSPFALNYVTVNSGGYTYPIADTTLGGIEVMAKDYNGQFYIFADTRDSETQTNIQATFTIADKNALSVTVVNENRTIQVVNGVFSDTFANGATVHIYQVNDGPTQSPGAPAAPTVNTFSPDTGASATDHITNANVLTLNGMAAASSTLTLYDGTALLGTADTDSSGHWSYVTAALGDGVHNFTATDALSGVTSSPSGAFTVTIDTATPAAPVITSDVTGSNSAVTISGTALDHGIAEAGDVVKIYDGSTLIGTTATNSSGGWTYATNPLASGDHPLTATVTDLAGNASLHSQVVDLVIDPGAPSTAPDAPSIAPDAPSIAAVYLSGVNVLTLGGSAEANTEVSIYDGSTLLGTTSVNASGAWNYLTPKLVNGTHTFTATDTDTADHTSAPSLPAIDSVYTRAPTDVFADAGKQIDGSFNITGNALDNNGVAQSGDAINIYDGTTYLGSTTSDSGGAWNFKTGVLSNSVHTFTSTVTDAVGNPGEGSGALIYGTAGSNTLVGTPGNDIMTGGGGGDTFVFNGTNFGKDVINNFQPGSSANHDVIQFNQNAFSGFASVLSHAEQVGGNVVISNGAAESVTLQNVALNKLTSADFHFV